MRRIEARFHVSVSSPSLLIHARGLVARAWRDLSPSQSSLGLENAIIHWRDCKRLSAEEGGDIVTERRESVSEVC